MHFQGSIVLGTLLLAGCQPPGHTVDIDHALNDYFVGDYSHAAQLLRPAASTTDENFVLNNVRLGSSYLAAYDLDGAEGAFLRAYDVMNSFGVNTGGQSAGAVLISESMKVWKGEPFERAMANFYLGLVYYIRHDYQNARAAFENALFKLRDYADSEDKKEDYRRQDSNFTIAYIMLGKALQRLGEDDLARANFDKAVKLQPSLRAVADYKLNAASNVLLVVDYGHGPQKETTFDNAVVGLTPTPRQAGPIPLPRVKVDGKYYELGGLDRPPVDLLALAQERQWQSIDTIRAIKSAVGTGLIAGGAYEGLRRHRDVGAAAALIGAGILLKASSQADVRDWEMLPRTVFILPLKLLPGAHDITINFPQENYSQSWRNVVAPAEGELTHYVRMTRMTNGEYDFPASLAHTEP